MRKGEEEKGNHRTERIRKANGPTEPQEMAEAQMG